MKYVRISEADNVAVTLCDPNFAVTNTIPSITLKYISSLPELRSVTSSSVGDISCRRRTGSVRCTLHPCEDEKYSGLYLTKRE